MSDINFSTPNSAHGLQVIDNGKDSPRYVGYKDSCESARDAARDAMHSSERHGLHVSDQINDGIRDAMASTERHGIHVSDKVGDGFDRTNDNICHSTQRLSDKLCEGFKDSTKSVTDGFSRTNDNMFMKFEHLDHFLAQNFKEQQLTQLTGFKDAAMQVAMTKADLQRQISDGLCETRALIRERTEATNALILAQSAAQTAMALEDAKREILALRLGATTPVPAPLR
jgi:hypothetical protein